MSTTTDESTARRGRVRLEPGAKRVRAFLGGAVVADTTRPVLVWEIPYYPAYYIPLEDVRAELVADGGSAHSPSRGDGRSFTVRAGGREAPEARAALRRLADPRAARPRPARLARDGRVVRGGRGGLHPSARPVHARRHPRELAPRAHRGRRASRSPSRPPRGSCSRPACRRGSTCPKPHVRLDLLVPSDTVSHCPYKGQAEWWSVRAPDGEIHADLAWSYRAPLPESQKVAGLIAFLDEKVDVLRRRRRARAAPHEVLVA